MRKRILLILLVILLSAQISLAAMMERITITGCVKDHAGIPLENVRVRVKHSDVSALTNHDGIYSFKYVPWKFNVIFYKKGYSKIEKPFNFILNKNAPVKDVILRKKNQFTPAAPREKTENITGMHFVYIPPGTFMMGSSENEFGRNDDETLHSVTLSNGFFMQTTEVTQKQWNAVMGSDSEFPDACFFKDCGGNCPAENVSWKDALEFIRRLNQREQTAGYRLPTEAEWEYACRSGNNQVYSFGNRREDIGNNAWFFHNSDGQTHPTAQKKPNAFGLYDMHGNVAEWCQDAKYEYTSSPATDPLGNDIPAYRVARGGSWKNYRTGIRSAYRYYVSPGSRSNHIGFRLVRQQDTGAEPSTEW